MFVRDIINHPDCQSRSPADNCPITEAECTRPCFFHFRFPEINFGNIEYILEIDQISKLYEDMADKNSSEVYMHIPHYDAKTLSLVDKYLGEIPVVNDDYTGGKETTLGSINFKMAFESPEASPGIPPSSAMSFLERKQIPTIVFTGYREQFNNPYVPAAVWPVANLRPATTTLFSTRNTPGQETTC